MSGVQTIRRLPAIMLCSAARQLASRWPRGWLHLANVLPGWLAGRFQARIAEPCSPRAAVPQAAHVRNAWWPRAAPLAAMQLCSLRGERRWLASSESPARCWPQRRIQADQQSGVRCAKWRGAACMQRGGCAGTVTLALAVKFLLRSAILALSAARSTNSRPATRDRRRSTAAGAASALGWLCWAGARAGWPLPSPERRAGITVSGG